MIRGYLKRRDTHPYYPMLIVLLSLQVSIFGALVAVPEEDFSCRQITGLVWNGDPAERAAIIPREDVIVEVGNETTKKVLCRFNSSLVNAENVIFSTKDQILPSKIVNSSTIRLEIQHSKPKKYTLFCKLKKETEVKSMCSQLVSAGYSPLDIVNLSCLSFNNEKVNCSWSYSYNPILTNYAITYSVPSYRLESSCPNSNPPFFTWCEWNHSYRSQMRDAFDLHIAGTNALGMRKYTHRVNISEIVIPRKIFSSVSLIDSLRVKISWKLSYPMDVFHDGLWHFVESRMKGDLQWNNVTFFFHKKNPRKLDPDRYFSVEEKMPYAAVEYEFRVRIHTGVGEIKEEKWSGFDILKIKTKPLPPSVKPNTILSSFEVVEQLDVRDIYIYYQDVDEIFHGGEDFRYDIRIYSKNNRSLNIKPIETTRAYFKYKSLDFDEYKFEIRTANEKGLSSNYSDVIVPNSDCMPKKTEMFTVITNSVYGVDDKLFSLYWVPSVLLPSKTCEGSKESIDSYTIFWCKKTFGDRCKEKLYWKEIAVKDIPKKDLSDIAASYPTIFEYNITDFMAGEIFSFGIAANSGNYSSGIKWSSCIVDDTEPPLPPVTEVEAMANDSRSVLVKWSMQCKSISAVPVGFNISYCKSESEDFGHCSSEVKYATINSPASSDILIKDLDGGFSYIFSVAVLSIIGTGRQSEPKIMKLLEDDSLSWWLISLIVLICSSLTGIVFIILKFGWRSIMKSIKDCRQKINLPKGIDLAKKPHDYWVIPKQPVNTNTRNLSPSFLQYDNDDIISPNVPELKNSQSKATRSNSASSDKAGLIIDESSQNHNLHMSELSSTGRSTGYGSSVFPDDTPSFTPDNVADSQSESTSTPPLRVSNNHDSTSDERTLGTQYVLPIISSDGKGATKGYVTAWSVPSLHKPDVREDGNGAVIQSTSSVNSSSVLLNSQVAGQLPDMYGNIDDQSGSGKEVQFISAPATELCKVPSDVTVSQQVPFLSRIPDMVLVADSQKDGYVTLTNGRETDIREPALRDEPYVSAGLLPSQDSMIPAKRPSLLKLQKNSLEEEKPLPEAYCHVGSSQSPLTPGYVSASCVNKSPVVNPTEIPYMNGTEEMRLLTFASETNCLHDGHTVPSTSPSPYVYLKDSERWAVPVNRQRPPSTVSSASEPYLSNGVNKSHCNISRPNTSETAVGHNGKKFVDHSRNSCLSKQSSGYVSEETVINPSKGLVMSPNRFLNKATLPHTIVLSSNQEASKV